MPSYVTNKDLYWKGILKGIAKSSDPLQPMYEALTNSLEAIDMRRKKEIYNPSVTLDFYFNTNLEEGNDGLSRLVVTDNGIGFDDSNFKRLQVFKDDTKGYANRGSGRIQLVKFFKMSSYESVYTEQGQRKLRRFSLSQIDSFLNQNAIIRIDNEEETVTNETDVLTKLVMTELVEKTDVKFYNDLTIDDLKQRILNHYMLYFCVNRDSLPNFVINYYHIDGIIATRHISTEDIPCSAHEDVEISIPVNKMSADMKRIEATEEQVGIKIKSYKLLAGRLKKNLVKVTCKGEVVDSVKVKLNCLPDDMRIDSSYFLFLLSSQYFDDNVGDTRDSLTILNKTEFKKRAKQFGSIEPQIVLDDIETQVSNKASEMFSEIQEQQQLHTQQLASLKQTYLLSDEALEEADINDSVEDILRKAYAYDAKLIAEKDAAYHSKMEQLNELDTRSASYQSDMQHLVEELVQTIPLQDKESLARYVTHRRLVLDLMDKILHQETDAQRDEHSRNEDEKMIHNLLFAQHSDDTSNSDLWMLNEDFLYFKGYSEHRLNQIEIEGRKLFRENISEEEERYLTSLGEDRRLKRPDILLFPAERKCIIIELKSLTANVSEYLDQIKKYCYFILNFASDGFFFDTFYGYLIGEAVEPRDVRAADGRFKYDKCFNYMYLPNANITNDADVSGNHDGSLYMEVITYSEILKRANSRNEMFTSKLFSKPVISESTDVESNAEK